MDSVKDNFGNWPGQGTSLPLREGGVRCVIYVCDRDIRISWTWDGNLLQHRV